MSRRKKTLFIKKKKDFFSFAVRASLSAPYRLSRAAAASTYPAAAASESAAVHRARLAPRPPLA
jgi:hypothetical protein